MEMLLNRNFVYFEKSCLTERNLCAIILPECFFHRTRHIVFKYAFRYETAAV